MQLKNLLFLLWLPVSTAFLNSCRSRPSRSVHTSAGYNSPTLQITPLTENSFVHTSYKQTNDFGNVPCNGLLVRDGNEIVVFDTPTNDSGATELIRWVEDSLHCRIRAVVPTHFHDDCLGGLNAFHRQGIPSYANARTIALARENKLPVPQNAFNDSLQLTVGKEQVAVRFFGEGHTRDNVVGYFPREQVLFGGCLLKELNASKGYLGDANTADWSATVEKVKAFWPGIKKVVPGHGASGDGQLLEYTIRLFKTP